MTQLAAQPADQQPIDSRPLDGRTVDSRPLESRPVVCRSPRVTAMASERHPHHQGRVVRLTLNQGFVDAVGPGGVAAYVAVLVDVAGREGLTVSRIADALSTQWARRGVRTDEVSVRHLAEQLADPERVALIVEHEDGRRLVDCGCTLADEIDDEGYPEPMGPGRPFYS